jgi:Fe-S cluster assembly iron-binding protein IscA
MPDAGYQIIWLWHPAIGDLHATTAVTISGRAAPHREILKTEGDSAMLRIGMRRRLLGFSTSSTSARPGGRRLVIARDGAVILVDPASVPFLAGSSRFRR